VSAKNTHTTRLRSGQYGNGGRTSNGNGHSDVATNPNSHSPRMAVVSGKRRESIADSWSQRVAGNTTRYYRNER